MAALDVYDLGSGRVVGTILISSSAGSKEAEVEGMLRGLDDAVLPDVDLDAGSLSYTVARGEVWGQFEATAEKSKAES